MTARGLFGKRGAVYGGWISKPGVDVFTSSPGQNMLDTNSQNFQIIQKGVTLVLSASASSIPAGSVYSVSESIPGAAGFSDVVVQINYYLVRSDGVVSGEELITGSYLYWRLVSGNLNISLYFRDPGGAGGGPLYQNHYAAWSVFRASIS